MQHAGAHALSNQAAPAVFPETHHSKAHHLGAASGHSSAAGQSGQSQGSTDGSGGNRQGQGNANDHRHQNAHEEGLQHRGPLDEVTHRRSSSTDGSRHQPGKADACQDGHNGGHQNVNPGLLGYQLAALRRHNGHEVHRQRPAGAAHSVGSKAHRNQGKQHHRRAVQGKADGNGNARTYHSRGQAADGVACRPFSGTDGDDDLVQESNAELLTDGVENGAHQQRTEQALGHGSKGINSVALHGENHVFAQEKFFQFVHESLLFPAFVWHYYTSLSEDVKENPRHFSHRCAPFPAVV